MSAPPKKALRLTWHSAFQSTRDIVLALNLSVSATVGGVCHVAERLIR